jgi:predicted DNA-binding transcriptional regulator AlpA
MDLAQARSRIAFALVKKLRFMGTAEIGQRLGVTRSRAHAITRDRDFPEAYQTLTMGSIWLADDVEAWIRQHRPALAEDPEGE